MDPSTDINQDPLTMNDTGATSFATDFDMSAINEAVAAGGEADKIQNSFDVNDISLDNTPTTDAELQSQLNADPNMNLSGAPTEPALASGAPKVPEASFVDGDLANDAPAANPFLEQAPEEPEEPVDTTPNFDVNNFDSANIDATPVEDDPEPETPVEPEAPKEPEEPATIADLANAATSDPAVTPAPELTLKADAEPEKAPEIAPAAPVEDKAKSKMPTYLLIGLAVVAVVAVVIAVIVSLG